MTTIKDICQLVKYGDIVKALNYYYPTYKNNYADCYEFIKTESFKDLSEKELLVLDVHRFDDEYYSITTIETVTNETYSVAFRRWEELANIPISEETLKNNLYEEIVAHFIWEIAFYGTQEQTKIISDKIKKSSDDIKSGKAKTIPSDEFLLKHGTIDE